MRAKVAREIFGADWRPDRPLEFGDGLLNTLIHGGIADFAQAAMKFIMYAELSPDLTFLLTKVGCGIAGYDEKLIMDLFATAPANVILPEGWTRKDELTLLESDSDA